MTTLEKILARIEETRRKENAVWEHDQNYPLEKALKTARRLNKKAARELPLLAFAGQVELTTPEEIQTRYSDNHSRYARQLINSHNYMAHRAKTLAMQVAHLVEEHVLADWNIYRERMLPQGNAYEADFWSRKLKELISDRGQPKFSDPEGIKYARPGIERINRIMGPYCKFCDLRCFVPFPEGTPAHIIGAYRPGVTIIATCPEGQAFEKKETGYCYSDILREIENSKQKGNG